MASTSSAASGQASYRTLKVVLVLTGLILASVILLSIWLTNRFLTRFVFRRIEEPLDILALGVRKIGSGDLDYRIQYNGQDEFAPVCVQFNEMGGAAQAVCGGDAAP